MNSSDSILKEKSCLEDDYIRLNRLLCHFNTAVNRLSKNTLKISDDPGYLQRCIGYFLGELHDFEYREVYSSPQALYNSKIYHDCEAEECDELPF